MGLNWPKEYGGLGLGPVYQHILVNEFGLWGVPGPALTVTSVGPMIMRYGTQQNKEEFLPLIARGEMFAVGYSEPDSGTDLASLKTRADLDGDEWVINGQKIWNSNAHMATHEWLCVRTNHDVPKHRGISVIMVPINSPGIEVRPLITWGGVPDEPHLLHRCPGAEDQPHRRERPWLAVHHRRPGHGAGRDRSRGRSAPGR